MSACRWLALTTTAFAFGLSNVALAADPPPASAQNANRAAIFKFSDVKSVDVVNQQGEKLGKIEDLVYHPRDGRISYAVLSFGSTLGFGGKLFAVPVHALKPQYDSVNNKHSVLFNVDKKTLETAQGFDKDHWPDVGNPRWSTEVDKHYPDTRNNDRNATTSDEPGARVSQLVGLNVRNDANESLGKVDEAVVDLAAGKIRYLAIAFGGFLGMGDKLFAVPFDALRAAREKDSDNFHIVLHVSKEHMKQAPGFDKNHWPDVADRNFAADIDRFYAKHIGHRAAPGTNSFKSSQIVGMRVTNPQGEHLGRIESLVLDLHSGKIRYAAVSFGGFLGMGDKLFAVPWGAMKVQYDTEHSQNHAILNVTKSQMEKAQGFDKNHWPNFADAQWANGVNSFYGLPPANEKGDMPARKIDDIVGAAVQNPQGEKLGKINEVVINLQNGTANYAALSFGGFLGMGDKLFAVPWRQIRFQDEANSKNLLAIVNVTKQSLEKAPSFDKNHWPDMAKPDWSRDVDSYYGDQASATQKPIER